MQLNRNDIYPQSFRRTDRRNYEVFPHSLNPTERISHVISCPINHRQTFPPYPTILYTHWLSLSLSIPRECSTLTSPPQFYCILDPSLTISFPLIRSQFHFCLCYSRLVVYHSVIIDSLYAVALHFLSVYSAKRPLIQSTIISKICT